MSSNHQRRNVARILTTAVLITTAIIGLAPQAQAAPASVSGTVVCNRGGTVVGIWVDSTSGGSGWASFNKQPGAANAATYQRTIDSGGSVSLHVGCGGSPSSWGSDNWTPAVAIGGGRTMNTFCDEAAGRGAVRCSLPATGGTKGANTFGAGYCTWGAAEKFRQVVGAYPGWNGDAKTWATNARAARWTVVGTPLARSIVVLQPGGGTNAAEGHVAFVDWLEYRADGVYLHTTDMNSRGLGVWSNEVRKHQSSMQYIALP